MITSVGTAGIVYHRSANDYRNVLKYLVAHLSFAAGSLLE